MQVMILHLREQLKELQRTKEALALSKHREETLQIQVIITKKVLNSWHFTILYTQLITFYILFFSLHYLCIQLKDFKVF